MENQNLGTVYANKRAEYNKYNGVYALGTFVNTDAKSLTGQTSQLTPTDRTLANFDTLSDSGYSNADFQRDRALYTVDSEDVVAMMTDMFEPMKVTAEIAEFLEGAGNKLPEHTLRVSEITGNNNDAYYFMQAGASALESSSNALHESDPEYNYTLFRSENNSVQIAENAVPVFVLEYVNHVLGKDLNVADIIETSDIGQDYDQDSNSNLVFVIVHVKNV